MNIINPKNKIGVGIITYNREDLFYECLKSLAFADEIVVVNDGKEFKNTKNLSNINHIIQHDKNYGVAKSKNDALKYLLKQGCENIFLCEDDVKIINENVFEEYIKASETSGIQHLNYAYHGPTNKNNISHYQEIKYEKGVGLSFHRYPIGAFTFYTRTAIEKVGLLDERFHNFHDHVDHTARFIKAKLHPPYGWFADIVSSDKFISDQDPELSRSTNKRNTLNYSLKYYYYYLKYIIKNGNPKVSEITELNSYLINLKSKNKFNFVR